MICRKCGTEIADKAIVCYRCGQATAEPPPRSGKAAGRPAGNRLAAVLALVILIVAGLFMGTTLSGPVPRVLAWGLAALGLLLLGWRLLRRR